MADETPQSQRRVLPARNRRESVAKRQASSPIPTESPGAKKIKTEPTPGSEPRIKRKYTKRASLVRLDSPSFGTPSTAGDEPLPTRLHSSIPLPTSSSKQDGDLASNEYQSIADSAILSASLYRSRMQWLCDGVFKKYWTKPSRRKGVVEQPPNNPDQKTMTKLGTATITIEPHTFEVVFYTVKDQQTVTPAPIVRHPNQHTPKPPYPLPSGIPYPPPPSSLPAPSPSPAPIPAPVNSSTASAATGAAMKQDPGAASAPTPSKAVSVPVSSTSQPQPTPATPVTRPPPPPPQPKQDPVIQMLASRAAVDSRLKDLMKVVAASKANAEQLKEFQAHIDEFNGVIRKQEAERLAKEKSTPKSHANPPTTPASQPNSVTATPATTYSQPTSSVPATPYLAYPPPQPRVETVVKHIVLEFTSLVDSNHSASTDRWLFPEYAVLDFRGQHEMLCSFFVGRKGSELLGSHDNTSSNAGKWKAGEEYYQPVTMTVRTNAHKTIETIARAAKSLPVVQERMKEVIEKKKRAPVEYLVHQLPREKQLVPANEFQDSGVELNSGDEDDELKDIYGN